MAAQCELLDLARSTYYYEPATESVEKLALMRRIDAQYLQTPFYGSRRMAAELSTEDCPVKRKRVQRLMRTMGIAALYPRKSTSVPGVGHRVYPYLLRGLTIDRANQVAISMDGRGRALDNVFIERLWWSVKWEDVYLKVYGTVADLQEGLARYFDFYDHRRKHQSLDDRTPYEIFQASLAREAEGRNWRPKYPLGDTILN